jgi:hypothetical protein
MYSSWVSGHAVRIERAPIDYRLNGWGLTSSVESDQFTGEDPANNFYHVAIPTPVIVEDKRATLHAVHYLFDARDGAELVGVLVYDGVKPLVGSDKSGGWHPVVPGITGDHTHGLDAANGIEVNHDGILWGVGITLWFQGPRLPQGDSRPRPNVFFASFGADFYHNI